MFKESLYILSQLIADYQNEDYKVMMKDLMDKGLVPELSEEESQYIETIMTIRTENTFPGTRYFHAEYEQTEGEEYELQRVSFEFRPKEKALSRAILALRSAFKLTTDPKNIGGFYQWTLTDGRILWAKKMSYDELKNSPLNASTPSDEGTIRITIEKEIHGPGDGHSH